VASIFCSDAPCHMTTSASAPLSLAANATACAWLPALIAITPLALSSCVRWLSLFSAPRALNDPVRWKSSHLRRARSVRLLSVGVRARRSPIVARARSTSSLVGSSGSATLPERLIQQDRGGVRRVEAVDGAGLHGDGDLDVGSVSPVRVEAGVLGADDERRRLRQVGVL